jgi:hypothetical protein
VLPAGLDEGLRVIEAVVTMNGAEAESLVLPLTVIVYVPTTAVDKTVNDPNIEPLMENVHVAAVTMVVGVLVTHGYVPASLGLNPLPVIVTVLPAGPDVGLSVIGGTGNEGKAFTSRVTVKSKSPTLFVRILLFG